MKTVGRYEILREVGRGGMAMVYLARQTDLDRFVALKELGAFHASDESFAQRFLRESRVAGSLSHPNVVTVHDYFQHDGTPYIAMEYVERGSLRPYVGKMSLAQIGGVLEGLLAGLAHAEQHGIVHRDLKPENLMVTSDGRVKIADFGIAKASTKMQTGAFLTATGTTVGTPTYMAPEQAMAQDIGPWTDLYSVGCMAFEMFTGNVPFHDSDAPMAILLRHVNEPIPPVKSLDPSVDRGISDWIEALLIKDPEKRTRSSNDAWDEFEEIIIGLLGPRWRREARLLERVEHVDTPKPLTPAPFEGTTTDGAVSDEFQSFAWGSAVGSDTGGATAAPPPGPYTPPPGEDAVVPDTPPVGQPTPEPSSAVPPPAPPATEPAEDSGFMTFGAPAPSPPTDALIPPAEQDEAPAAEAPAAEAAAPAPAPVEETAPPEESTNAGFETYVAPPPLRPPTDEPPLEPAAPETAAPPEPEPAPPVEAPPAVTPEPVAAATAPPPAPAAPPTPVQPEEPEVAATVMPDAVQNSLITPAPARPGPPPRERERDREGGGKRNLFPVIIIAGAVVAAIVGFLAGGSGGGDKKASSSGGTPTVVAASPDVKAKVPDGWAKLSTVPAVPGLELSDGAAFGPAGKDGGDVVMLGGVGKSAANSTLLPAGLIKAAGTTLPEKEAVESENGLQGYRYRNVKLAGFDRPVTIYAVPTTEGVVTLACLGAQSTCDASANTMELVSAKPFPVGPSKDYAKAVGDALGALNRTVKSGQAKLSSAKTPQAQASAARSLSAAYAKAAKALRGLDLSPADQLANAKLVAALTATSKAYANAAKAASKHDKKAYAQASKAVDKGQKAVSDALAGIKSAGYDVTT
jgi:hypothetical protein